MTTSAGNQSVLTNENSSENVPMLYNSAHIFRPNIGSGYVWRHANNTIPNIIYHPYGFVAFILEGFHKKTLQISIINMN